jgi:hypothetical protein
MSTFVYFLRANTLKTKHCKPAYRHARRLPVVPIHDVKERH